MSVFEFQATMNWDSKFHKNRTLLIKGFKNIYANIPNDIKASIPIRRSYLRAISNAAAKIQGTKMDIK